MPVQPEACQQQAQRCSSCTSSTSAAVAQVQPNNHYNTHCAYSPAIVDQEQSSDVEAAVTRQMQAIQEAIQQAVQDDRQAREAGQLPEHVARHFMRDPLGMILSSQGVPMGISLKVETKKMPKHRREQLHRCVRRYDGLPWSSAD